MKLFVLILAITLFVTALAEKKFHLSKEKKNWFKAVDACIKNGMKLGSVLTKEDNDQLVKMIKDSKIDDSFWVGATSHGTPQKKDDFYWFGLDQKLNFTNWNKDQPSNPSSEPCIELRKGFDFSWNDVACTAVSHYVCEELPDSAESETTTKDGAHSAAACRSSNSQTGESQGSSGESSQTGGSQNPFTSWFPGFGGMDLSVGLGSEDQNLQEYDMGNADPNNMLSFVVAPSLI